MLAPQSNRAFFLFYTAGGMASPFTFYGEKSDDDEGYILRENDVLTT